MDQNGELRIKESILSCDSDNILQVAKEEYANGNDPVEIIQAMTQGMRTLGQKMNQGEVFLAEVMIAAEGVKQVLNEFADHLLGNKENRKKGTVVLGTVKGDIHTIGKDLVGTFLLIDGFEVHDLGINITAEEFIDQAKQKNADIIAASALLSTTIGVQAELIEMLQQEGLRERFKVMVGGGVVTEDWAQKIGADAYGEDAAAAVEAARKLVS